jgi:hypothetical protein
MMTTLTIDRARLELKARLAFGQVKYLFGAKPPLNGTPSKDFTKSDCSGFVRWLLYQASKGGIKIPSGSWYQREWCEDHRLKKTADGYAVGAALSDGRIRIAFFSEKQGRAGHVWLIINGKTIECYGGKGAGSRAWNTPVLLKNVEVCYVLTNG